MEDKNGIIEREKIKNFHNLLNHKINCFARKGLTRINNLLR